MSIHRYMRGAGRASARLLLLTILAVFSLAAPAAAQDWFRTGTGLGVNKPKVAVADFVSRNDASASMAALFSDVVRNDLDYSGILELASKSFYPTQVPSVPMELNYQAWSDPPASAQFLAFGNLTVTDTSEEIQAFGAAGSGARLSRRLQRRADAALRAPVRR
jgi:hypothetical protein